AAGSTVTTQYGSLTVSANGDWSFTPVADVDNSNGNPTDGFSYTITDGDGDTSTAQQAIEITDGGEPIARDDGPDSGDGGATVAEGTNSVGGNVLDNDDAGADGGLEVVSFTYTDENGDEQSASAGDTVNTQYGELTVNGDGTWSYTSDASEDHSGGDLPDNFTYTVSDADGSTDSATQYITVTDGVPTAVDDATVSVEEGGNAVTGDVMANDVEGPDGASLTSFDYTDANGQAQTATAGSTVTTANGSLTVNGDGTWSFTPNASVDNTNGAVVDGFSYTITDGDGDTSTAQQAIEITDGTAPEAIDDTAQSVGEGGNAIGGNVLANDVAGSDGGLEVTGFSYTDESGQQQTGTLGQSVDTQYGTLTVNGDGSWTYVSDASEDHSGSNGLPDGFSYTIADADGTESTASQGITVTDGVPVAVDDATVTVEEGGSAVTGDVMANDSEGPDGASLTSFGYTDANGQAQTANA
ncbi:Ig-like domain-containing protein, partial [Marivibrio halodurans]|uniref:Ig-like domain-containing protein n=1 Tax=Marivibrio halodurans TaxID=2039722 RepID=UPI003618A18C